MRNPWKESYDQPRQHIKKQSHYFVNKVRLLKAMVFPVVMYGCESWTIKKAECWRIDAFELWCWRRLLRVPWAARSNQSILKETSPGCSLEGLMLKLKLQYFGHLMWRADSLKNTPMLGKIEGRRRRGRQRRRWLDCITNSMELGLGGLQSWWRTGRPGVLQFMGSQRVRHYWATELNWIECLMKESWTLIKKKNEKMKQGWKGKNMKKEKNWNLKIKKSCLLKLFKASVIFTHTITMWVWFILKN